MSKGAVLIWLTLLSAPALADPAPLNGCSITAIIRHNFMVDTKKAGLKGRWLTLTPHQWEFARGMYVGSPPVTGAMPPGDGAALASVVGKPTGAVYFTAGRSLCLEMFVGPAVVKAIMRVVNPDLPSDDAI